MKRLNRSHDRDSSVTWEELEHTTKHRGSFSFGLLRNTAEQEHDHPTSLPEPHPLRPPNHPQPLHLHNPPSSLKQGASPSRKSRQRYTLTALTGQNQQLYPASVRKDAVVFATITPPIETVSVDALTAVLRTLADAPALVGIEAIATPHKEATLQFTYSPPSHEAVRHLVQLQTRISGLRTATSPILEALCKLDDNLPRLVDGAWMINDTLYLPLVVQIVGGERTVRAGAIGMISILGRNLPLYFRFTSTPKPLWVIGTALSFTDSSDELMMEASVTLAISTQILCEEMACRNIELARPSRHVARRIVQMIGGWQH